MKPTPLQWPAGRSRTYFRETPRTSLSIANALPALRKELELLGVIRVVVTSNAKLRQNGDPYSHQPKSVEDPGVAVWFEHVRQPGQHYCLSCDQYDTIGGNLREIGLAVGELRGFTRRMLLPVTEALKPFITTSLTVASVTTSRQNLATKVVKTVPEWQVVLGVDKLKKLTWKDCLTAYQTRFRAEQTQAGRDRLVIAQTEAARHFGKDV